MSHRIFQLKRSLLAASAALMAFTVPALSQAAGTAPQKPARQQCFYSNQINGWNRVDDHTIRVHVGASRAYDLTVMGTITDLAFREHIGLKASPSDQICTGNGLGVSVVTTGAFGNSYAVTNIATAPTKSAAHALKKTEKRASREDRVSAGPGARSALSYVESSTPGQDQDRSPGSVADPSS